MRYVQKAKLKSQLGMNGGGGNREERKNFHRSYFPTFCVVVQRAGGKEEINILSPGKRGLQQLSENAPGRRGKNRFLYIYKRTFDFLRPLPPLLPSLRDGRRAPLQPPYFWRDEKKKRKSRLALSGGGRKCSPSTPKTR